MQTSIARVLKRASRRSVVAVALAMIGLFSTYEVVHPAAAKAAPVAEPTAAPLDANSVAALLSLDRAMETLAARVTPAVVNVAVTTRQKIQTNGRELPPGFEQFAPFFGPTPDMQPQAQVEHGIGSGVLISPDGYIVTNEHVVKDAVDIRVTTTDKRVWAAKLIGTDPLTDLAVIKISGSNLPNLPWGNSNNLRPGQTVLAFGNPMGLRFTVTRGIVSALNRPNPFSTDGRKPGAFIQTDAAINPGNSGGALVDARGELVGINTFLLSSTGGFSGMGFAIPSQIVEPTVQSLIRSGKVTRGYMGVNISDVTPDNAKFFELKDANGALVSQVEPDSPGGRAGLKVGDVITGLNGKAVPDAGQLQVAIQQASPGTVVNLDVIRNGKHTNVPVKLESLSEATGDKESAANDEGKGRWGIGLSDLTPQLRDRMDVPKEVHGAVIGNVVPGSPADNAGLSRGDVIQEVNRKPVRSAEEVQTALSTVPKGQNALVLVWSHGASAFRVLHSAESSQSPS